MLSLATPHMLTLLISQYLAQPAGTAAIERCYAGPSVQFQEACLDFGLLQVGSQTSQQLTLQNTSQYQSAWWSLRETPKRAQQAGVDSSADKPPFKFGAQQAQHGMPAALQAKEQELLQQLQVAEAAPDSTSAGLSAAAMGNATAGLEGSVPAAQHEAGMSDQAAAASAAIGAAASQTAVQQGTSLQPEVGSSHSAASDFANQISAGDNELQDAAHEQEPQYSSEHSPSPVQSEQQLQSENNPFLEGEQDAAEVLQGPRLLLSAQCGRLAPGATVTVEVGLVQQLGDHCQFLRLTRTRRPCQHHLCLLSL